MDWLKSVDWVKVTQVALNVVQAAALLVGGLWVYFKFIKSRTFARRAELDLNAALLTIDGRQLIRAEVSLRNAGLSSIPLRPHRQVLTLWASATSALYPGANLVWRELALTEVFTIDAAVESQEAIKDVALLPIEAEGGPWLAFRVRAEAWAEPRYPWSERVKWVTHAIVPVVPEPVER